eukprot:6181061-Pleurochrysis_carterae.AAC.1
MPSTSPSHGPRGAGVRPSARTPRHQATSVVGSTSARPPMLPRVPSEELAAAIKPARARPIASEKLRSRACRGP